MINEFNIGMLIRCKDENIFNSLMHELEEQGYTWDSGQLPTKSRPIKPIAIKNCVFQVLDNKQIKFYGTGYTPVRYPKVLEYKIQSS